LFSKCQELCHSTFCRDCQVFNEGIKCHRGQTAIKPKFQCLQTLRMCFFLCKRAHECGHAVNHWCHNDGKCPPCTHTVFKMCVGEHRSFYVKNAFFFINYFLTNIYFVLGFMSCQDSML
jgi:hypothetical protein